MTRQHVDHGDIVKFAQDNVNLSRDKANEYRAQARRLREKLDEYLSESPDFALRKILLSGSIAKGTALHSINDIDLACYISGADTPHDVTTLLDYLTERLRKAFPNFSPDQVKSKTYSVTVSFQGTGLDVDVVPILYYGDPKWYGKLVSQDDGSFLETSIPLHLEFIDRRKTAQEPHFAQVARLVKFWAYRIKKEQPTFRFKSFMIEMILSHLCDQELDLSDYPEALQHFFTYVARTGMREKIVFTDYYQESEVGQFSDPVQVIDPVNPENNVASLYTTTHADAIVDAALDAGDAIDAALAAPTKPETVYYWQNVFFGDASSRKSRMTLNYSVTDTMTFTHTHAVHIAAKVATDLKRVQRLYGKPSDERIRRFETEVVELLKGGYMDTVTYGFQRDGCWIEPTLSYTARDLFGVPADDDDPGRIRPGAAIDDESFRSYLNHSSAWSQLSPTQQKEFEEQIDLSRSSKPEPGVSGYWSKDLTYSAGNRALDRASLRIYL